MCYESGGMKASFGGRNRTAGLIPLSSCHVCREYYSSATAAAVLSFPQKQMLGDHKYSWPTALFERDLSDLSRDKIVMLSVTYMMQCTADSTGACEYKTT